MMIHCLTINQLIQLITVSARGNALFTLVILVCVLIFLLKDTDIVLSIIILFAKKERWLSLEWERKMFLGVILLSPFCLPFTLNKLPLDLGNMILHVSLCVSLLLHVKKIVLCFKQSTCMDKPSH